jgi:hypothetical protein
MIRPGVRSVGLDWMKYEYGRAVYVGVSYWTGKTPLGLLRCVFLFFSFFLNFKLSGISIGYQIYF